MRTLLAIIFLCLSTISGAQLTVRQVTLPVEVQAFPGATISVVVNVPDATQVSTFWVKAHNLSYANKAAISFNGGAFTSISNANVTVEGSAAAHGGIGGAYNTYQFHFTPSGVVTGANQISFRFVGTDGNGSGFRVLDFDFKDGSGTRLLPAGFSVVEDPNTWLPPLNNGPDIAAGLSLYQTATIVDSNLLGAKPITAHCSNCHTLDGRDLQYFAYSNYSIINRCIFHGLTEHQGEQIASYIRSLKTSKGIQTWGRPWNPPYQPGPGVDAKPIAQWAAGAGIDNIMASDRGTAAYIFPDGFSSQADIALSATLNCRQVPIALPLPDWNQWLPKYYPGDSYGAAFTSNNILKRYDGSGTGSATSNLRTNFGAGQKWGTFPNGTNYVLMGQWDNDAYNFCTAGLVAAAQSSQWNRQFSEHIYSVRQWQVVKMWEMMQEFGLEGEGQNVYGATYGETRTWPVNQLFRTGPFQMALPANENGVGGSGLISTTISDMWYQLQITMDASHRAQNQATPIDWPYNYGKFADTFFGHTGGLSTDPLANRISPSGRGEAMRDLLWQVKGLQIAANGIDPSSWQTGWQPLGRHMVIRDFAKAANLSTTTGYWKEFTTSERNQIITTVIRVWWAQTSSYDRTLYGAGGFITATHDSGKNGPIVDYTEDCTGNFTDGSFGQVLWAALGEWNTLGLDQTLINSIATWAAGVWTNPVNNWTQFIH